MFLILFLLPFGSGTITDNHYDVIIVGGGLSGLTAAYRLRQAQPDTRLLVIEAHNRLGGRIKSPQLRVDTNRTDRFDIGAQWIGSSNYDLLALIDELEIGIRPQFNDGSSLYRIMPDQQTYRSSTFDNINQTAIDNSIRQLNLMIGSILPDNPYRNPLAHIWMNTSVADLIMSSLSNITNNIADRINNVLQTTYDAPAGDISLLHFLLLVQSTGGDIERWIRENGDGTDAMRIDGSTNLLIEKLSQNIPFILSTPVLGIESNSSVATVITPINQYSANSVIIAIPPQLSSIMTFNPALSDSKQSLLANYNAHGNAYSFLLTYSRIFWRLQSLSGHVVYTNIDADLRWMTTFDATSNQGSAALYGVAHFGIDTIDDDARRDAYIEALVDLFQSDDARHFIDYSENQWCNDPFARGSIGIFSVNYQLPPDYVDLLIQSVHDGKVHFAGAETSTQSTGLMNGAVIAGIRAANAVLFAKKPSIDTTPTSADVTSSDRITFRPQLLHSDTIVATAESFRQHNYMQLAQQLNRLLGDILERLNNHTAMLTNLP